MTAPLIFIHYGDTSYLRYTLDSAVRFNRDKPVVLLGDRSNAHLRSLDLEHVLFSDYATGDEIELFDRIYRHMAGDRHGRREWTRFVFRRWFHIHAFLKARGIETFWTFDSDTLILTNLSAHEPALLGYDCTEQCSGSCMNGLVSSRAVVKGYVDKINALFSDEAFLELAADELQKNPRYAFTEMRAYTEYRTSARFSRVRLDAIVDGSAFVDSVCTLDEHRRILCDDSFETYPVRVGGRELKKIYLRGDGHIFMRHRASQQLVRLNALNMSWVPDALIARLVEHSMRRFDSSQCEDSSATMTLLSVEDCKAFGVWALPGTPGERKGLAVTEKLLDKLKGLRRRDPNIYPLY